MSAFTTPLKVEHIDGRYWRVLEAFEYRVGSEDSDEIISVPAGFVTDFASIPRFAWWLIGSPTGEYGKAAVKHDYLYSENNDEQCEEYKPRTRRRSPPLHPALSGSLTHQMQRIPVPHPSNFPVRQDTSAWVLGVHTAPGQKLQIRPTGYMTFHHRGDEHVFQDDDVDVDGGHPNRDHVRGYALRLETPDAIPRLHTQRQNR